MARSRYGPSGTYIESSTTPAGWAAASPSQALLKMAAPGGTG
ncbi:MAG: hypothetical protein Q7U84_04075 [Polynucleobacter sp.]|nr:hypothetical protein [Polynucleobacter sp.]